MIHRLPIEAETLYFKLFEQFEDPDMLEAWLRRDGVHSELVIFEETRMEWQEMIYIGTELQTVADKWKKKVFRFEGDKAACMYFIAETEEKIITLLNKYEQIDIKVFQVLAG